MFTDKRTGKPYTDIFGLREHLKNNTKNSAKYHSKFNCVTMDEMVGKCFNLKILIYFPPSVIVCNLYKSLNGYENKIYLNLYENHLSYIKDLKNLARKYQ